MADRKLFVLERRDKGTGAHLVAMVTDRVLIPQHGGRFNYVVTNDEVDLDSLYVLCALLNSRLMHYYYARVAVGEKNVLVRDPRAIETALRDRLFSASRELHELVSDVERFKRGRTDFDSKFFVEQINDRFEDGLNLVIADGHKTQVQETGNDPVYDYDQLHQKRSFMSVLVLIIRVTVKLP